MKTLFYSGAALLTLFEIANVYLIMPLPYSQRWHTIEIAYALYSWRWVIRVAALALIAAGIAATWRSSGLNKAGVLLVLLVAALAAYQANFVMAADAMFRQPSSVIMAGAKDNRVEPARVVIGIEINGDARAYPVQLIGYHHQVRDTVGGLPVMVTYCTVCRTGRVFRPLVDGTPETFRLVGMDQFNAMFEDATTKSWWRQATGEAIVGPRRGTQLADLHSQQMLLSQWLTLHPHSLVMQPDPSMRAEYSDGFEYENGTSRSSLTGTDPASWHDKSWVVGITVNGKSRAYDWQRLVRERVVNDELGGKPIVLVLSRDAASFFAYERPEAATIFSLDGDQLVNGTERFDLGGRGESRTLKPLNASQEFWHSWRSFQPDTDTY
jgi:hypothetical protein